MYQNILCPVDGSESSNRGLAEAVRLSADLGAQLHLLHVVDTGPLLMYMPVTADNFETARECGRQILARASRVAEQQQVATTTRLAEILSGRAATAISDVAEQLQPDLIVMGTNGRRGISRLLMGSDAAAVVAAADMPVMLVR